MNEGLTSAAQTIRFQAADRARSGDSTLAAIRSKTAGLRRKFFTAGVLRLCGDV